MNVLPDILFRNNEDFPELMNYVSSNSYVDVNFILQLYVFGPRN